MTAMRATARHTGLYDTQAAGCNAGARDFNGPSPYMESGFSRSEPGTEALWHIPNDLTATRS